MSKRLVAWLCGWLGAALLLAGSVHAADVPISAAARAHFRQGVALLQVGGGPRYRQAYEQFQAAYRDSPSPKILGNTGMCAMHLERDGEAISAYQRYLAEAGAINATERQQILTDLGALRGRSAHLVITVQPADALVVDERTDAGAAVVNRYQASAGLVDIRVHRGAHRFRAERAGFAASSWQVQVRPGTPLQHRFELAAVDDNGSAAAPLPAPSAGGTGDSTDGAAGAAAGSGDGDGSGGIHASTGFIIGAVVTGALAVGAGVVGGIALSNRSSFDDAMAAGDYPKAQDLRDTGQTLNVTTDVLLGATVAAAVTSVVLLFASDGESGDEPTVGAARWRVAAFGGVSGPGLLVHTAF